MAGKSVDRRTLADRRQQERREDAAALQRIIDSHEKDRRAVLDRRADERRVERERRQQRLPFVGKDRRDVRGAFPDPYAALAQRLSEDRLEVATGGTRR
jgi:hypothetical protein